MSRGISNEGVLALFYKLLAQVVRAGTKNQNMNKF